MGLVDDARWARFEARKAGVAALTETLRKRVVHPEHIPAGEAERLFEGPLSRDATAESLLKRPRVTYADLEALGLAPAGADPAVTAQVEIQVKYAGYIRRQQEEVARQQRHEDLSLPEDLDYDGVAGLSHEVRQKLAAARPATLGQAARIAGVTPAAVSVLLVHVKRTGGRRRTA
jgi:tRNA uridine 5-carboxymethylaminomethyl modification enzyme